MPYPNEHAARVVDPGCFQEDSFRRKEITPGVTIILGRLKGETSTTTQAYRFDKSKFTADEAKKWLKDHDVEYKEFEAAVEKNMITIAGVEFDLTTLKMLPLFTKKSE